jgi:hypothetical protein
MHLPHVMVKLALAALSDAARTRARKGSCAHDCFAIMAAPARAPRLAHEMVSAEQSTLRPQSPHNKVRIAVLDESTAAQLQASLEHESRDLELVWSGTSVDELRQRAPQAQVVLANIDYLGEDQVGTMNELVDRTGAELGIALYAYAKRELLDRLASTRVRPLRSPLNVPMLRCQMLGIIARNLLSGNLRGTTSPEITPPRYSVAQLGKLQQISTSIDCECPNHISTLLQSLLDFEAYSRNCENRNDADAAVHRLLYEHTAKARALMERALDRLIEHENIQV